MDDDVPTWDMPALRELVRGTHLRCEGAPDDVARLLGELGPLTLDARHSPGGNRLARYHGSDRAEIARSWRRALDEPARLITCRARLQLAEGWRWTELGFLNLLHHGPAVLLMVTRPGELADAVEPAEVAVETAAGNPASWALFSIDMDGTVVRAEGTTEALLGMSADAFVGTSVLDVIHPDDHTACLGLGAIASGLPGVARSLDHRVVRPDGSIVWVEATLTHDPAADQLQVLLVDTSLRRAQEAALQASREETRELAEEFQLLAEEIPSGAFRADAEGRVLFANSRFRALAGTRDVQSLVELAAPADARIVTDALRDVVARALAEPAPDRDGEDRDEDRDDGAAGHGTGGTFDGVQVEFRGRDDGRTLSLRLGAVRASGNHHGTVVGVLIDATPTAELRTRARTDSLTGLLNRAALNDHLDDVLATGRDLCVMFVDFDEFKRVNDQHGHHAGDEVLRVIARRLRNAVRGSEEVGRYGGDEFVVACTEVGPDTVANLRSRVEAVLDEPVHFDDTLWHPSASIGVAFSTPGDTAGAILRRADAEMYRIKRASRRRPPDELPA